MNLLKVWWPFLLAFPLSFMASLGLVAVLPDAGMAMALSFIVGMVLGGIGMMVSLARWD